MWYVIDESDGSIVSDGFANFLACGTQLEVWQADDELPAGGPFVVKFFAEVEVP